MTDLPHVNNTIQTNGTGQTGSSGKSPIYVGGSAGGVAADNTIQKLTKISDVITQFGRGPLAEDLAFALLTAGAPVYAIRPVLSVLPTVSAVAQTGSGPAMEADITGYVDYDNEAGGPFQVGETLSWGSGATAGTGTLRALVDNGTDGTLYFELASGVLPANDLEITGGMSSATADADGTAVDTSPKDHYQGIAEVMGAGALGTATFRYSLDNGKSYSPAITIPTSGRYEIGKSSDTGKQGGMLLFPSGTYVLGEKYTWTTEPAFYNASDLSATYSAISASNRQFDNIFFAGHAADATAAATLFASIDTQLVAWQGPSHHRFMGCMMSASDDSAANIVSAFSSDSSSHAMLVAAKDSRTPSAIPLVGWQHPNRPLVGVASARAVGALVSENLGRTASGPLIGTDAVDHDESESEVLNAARICSARSYPGGNLIGFYLVEGVMKSPVGSDFTTWEKRQVINTACRRATERLQLLINDNFDVNADGTLSDTSANQIKADVENAIGTDLLEPSNAKGKKGHVSAVTVVVDQTNNYASDETINVTISVLPKPRARLINNTIGLTRGATTEPDETLVEEAA